MRNKILILGAVAFIAYVLGSRVAKVQIDNGESVPHQLVRMWNDPRAKKQRHKAAQKTAKSAQKALDKIRK
jgi:hypothetical protein